jgi:pseudouridylate synthase
VRGTGARCDEAESLKMARRMNPYLEIRREVARALRAGKPVVALESTVISHGLPRPHNLAAARKVEAAVRSFGAIPATVGLIEGKLVVGLSPTEIEWLANEDGIVKVSRRDIGVTVSKKVLGATTVAGTMFIASQAGIRLFSTGGIGGVHRDSEKSFDISNDLSELGHTPVAVVCAGAKIILDLPRTLEVLETLGVPVIGYGTSEFPAFYCEESGLKLEFRVNGPEEAAEVMNAHWGAGLTSGMVIANPPPSETAMPLAEVEKLLQTALESAEKENVRGKAVTPYLLSHLGRQSGGRTLATNIALLVHNAEVAAQIAAADVRGKRSARRSSSE